MAYGIGRDKLQKAWEGCGRRGLRPSSINSTGFRSDCPVHGKSAGSSRNTTWGLRGDTVVWCCHSHNCHVDSAREGYEAVGLCGSSKEVRYIGDLMDKERRHASPSSFGRKEYTKIERTILARYDYLREDGRVWISVLRFMAPRGTRKQIRRGHPRAELGGALAYGDPPDWPSENQPLYRWKDVENADVVDIVEGEKAADYCAGLGLDAVTWIGGANSSGYLKANWGPLAGKKIRIWTDADEVGRQAGKAIAAHLAGDSEVYLLGLAEGDTIGAYTVNRGDGIDDAIEVVGLQLVLEYFDANSSRVAPPKGTAPKGARDSASGPPSGKPLAPLAAPGDSSQSEYILGYTDAELALPAALALLGIEIFFNVRGYFPAFTWRGRVGGEDVMYPAQLTKEWAGKIRNTIKRTCKLTRFRNSKEYHPNMHVSLRAWDDARDALLTDNKVDPYLKELEKVAAERPWDGVERVDAFLGDALGAVDSRVPLTEANHEVTQWISWALHAAPVKLAQDPGSHLDIVPVLWGAKETGKSAFLKLLMPPSAREGAAIKWFNDSENWGIFKDSKTVFERFCKHALVELAENVGVNKADAQMIKQRISSDSLTFRKAYGHDPVTVPRTWLVVVTSNTQWFIPNDGAQTARRWASCYIDRAKRSYKDLSAYCEETYQQRVAEVLHRLGAGASILPSRRVRDLITQYSPRHLYTNDYFAELMSNLMLKESGPLKTVEIMNYVNFGKIKLDTDGLEAERKIHHFVWQRDILPIVRLSWVKLRASSRVKGKRVAYTPKWHSPICNCGAKRCLNNPHRPLYKDLAALKDDPAKVMDGDDIELPF